MKHNTSTFGKVIKNARLAAGMTREDFSELIGKSPRYIAAMENEGQTPSYDTLCTAISALGIDANLVFYPDAPDTSDEFDRVTRLVKRCNSYELSVVAATVEALLKK